MKTWHAMAKRRMPGVLAILPVLWAAAAVGLAQESGRIVPADDMPPVFQILWAVDRDCQWTLIGENDKAGEQEALHAELNAIHRIWHSPLAPGVHALKCEFTRPLRKGSNVFHLYVKADGDDSTGRIAEGSLKGVDYTYTLIDGDPKHGRSNLIVYEADGRTRGGTHLAAVHENVLYLGAEMNLRQDDGKSLFEYMILSYAREQAGEEYRSVASSNFGFRQAVSEAEPDVPAPPDGHSPLINPDMKPIDGMLPGWQLIAGRSPVEATFCMDEAEGALVVEPLFAPEGLAQTVSLGPGHYLLRALTKTNVFQIHLFAERERIPIGMADEYRWIELPFCIPPADASSKRTAQVGFRYLARPASGPASRLPAKLFVKKVELLRLGDTVRPERWVETLPADPLHRLKLINDSPAWNRPGKVVFEDAFIGTELWLMTQEGQVDHSYVGYPDFSHEGKYLHIGMRKPPRGLLRTDGSVRYRNDNWTGLPWLFPWEQKHLPEGADPADWICESRNLEEIVLHNPVNGQTVRIPMPSRPGWILVENPSRDSGRGPDVRAITHDTLVWHSEDRRYIGLSDTKGTGFRQFELRSISARPEEDTLFTGMSSVGGKGGTNWRNAVDRDGNRYFLFEINRDNFPNHPTNPYQVWALCLHEGDSRGLLRVVFHPNATISDFVSSQSGMTSLPSANWWEFAAGFPWSGDNAILMLEDETLVHMSSLGMHSAFFGGNTVSVNCAYTGEVRFIGSFPRFDRITWPHEFRRDRDFAVVASHAEPTSPIVMLDLEHSTMWNLVLTHFHDYAMRYRTRWNKDAYHKPMFRPAPTFSPDFTKVVYFSAMLTGDHPDRKWADVYIAVARYPQPPAKVRVKRGLLPWKRHSLTWERPHYHAEIEGFNLYRSDESGRTYTKVNRELLTQTEYELPPDAEGFYVLTSVEYSGLESRMFSNEVLLGSHSVFRHFYQAENGRLTAPMVPFFEPAEASCAYAVAIADPELLYREELLAGRLAGSVTLDVAVPSRGLLRVLARVRAMSPMERTTYTTGRSFRTDPASGTFTVKLAGRNVGEIPVSGPHWQWVGIADIPSRRPWGTVELEFATSDAGIAIDNILVTNDPAFVPRGRGQEPETPPTPPEALRVERFGPEDRTAAAELLKEQTPRVKLVWAAATAPQGLSHYNVYRADAAVFDAEAETLLSSPRAPVFYDCGLDVGQTVYYRVRAVDAWGNRSPASAPLAVTAQAPALEAAFRIIDKQDASSGEALTFDASASRCDTGRIEHWHWTFGDGASGQGRTVSHTFAEPGTYVVGLTVGSDRGEWARAEQSVHVRPGWIREALEQGAVWIEAEDKTGEGDGTSQQLLGRVNASGAILSYWEKDLGHWLEWTVEVPRTGSYGIALKYATGSARALRDCRIDGEFPGEAWQQQVFPGTGGFSSNADNWAWRVLQDADGRPLQVDLTEGPHTLRMANLGGGMALDVLMLVPSNVLPAMIR